MGIRNLILLLFVFSSVQDIDSGDRDPLKEGVERRKKSFNRWTSEMDTQLDAIYRSTRSNASHHFERVKNEWYKLHPSSKISKTALYKRYLRISHQIKRDGERPKRRFRWNEEKYADLIDTYLNTRPYNQYSSLELNDEWKCRHQDSPNYENKYLSKRAREWIEKRKLDVQGESSRRLFEWTYRRDSDLLHMYHVTMPEGRRRAISMHRIFADLHPDLRGLTADQMAERIQYLRKNPPDDHFPWTKEQNKELLEIYQSTSPEVADQGQRIYDIWTKLHPRYKYMTPHYLQIHACTLANHDKIKGSGRSEKTKFTHEQKAFAIDAYRRLMEPNKSLYDFHKAWVREYPSMAYLTPHKISWNVHNWMTYDDSSSEGMTEGEQQSEHRQYRRQKKHKYTPEEKAELVEIFYQTDPERYGHSDRILKRWIEKHEDAKNVNGKILRMMIQDWIKQDRKIKGKEPMLIPKSEVESESFSSASDMSQ